MDEVLRQLVWRRAADRCEYCQLAQAYSILPFEIDHVIARKHRGKTIASNLALSCYYANSFQGSDIASIDIASGKLSRLYNPRRHRWSRHFRWNGPFLIGLTGIGRTTVQLLQINHPQRVEQRIILIAAMLFPPDLAQKSLDE
jgi:hypothetical protein